MSTIHRQPRVEVPPLVEGEHLDAATFMERYEAMPPGTWAELIGGVVVMPSPVGPQHCHFVGLVTTWIGYFTAGIPGLFFGCDGTTILDADAVVQPDIKLRILPEFGGQTWIAPSGYIAGAPELIVEVSHSSKTTDLGSKLKDYERTGVLEYLVVAIEPEAVTWFIRRDDSLVPHTPGTDGVYRSECFPGLWLDPVALFERDLAGLFATLDLGRATPEHAAFVARLQARRGNP